MTYDKQFLIEYLYNYLSSKTDHDFIKGYIEKIPKKLYRFRSCTENDFNAISNDYIWLSLASEFDDIKDSTIKYNFKSQKDEIFDIYCDWFPHILKTELKKKYPKIDFSRWNVNRGLIDEYLDNTVDKSGTYNRNKMKSYLLSKGLKTSDITVFDQFFKNYLTQDNIEKVANSLMDDFSNKMLELKDSFLATCFTQTYKNDNLWQTYAKKYTGFCIEYDLSKVEANSQSNLLFQFAPMLYGAKKPFDFVELFKIAKMEYCKEDYDKQLVENMDVQLNLQARTKSKTYDHEKEWRLYLKKDSVKTRKYFFPYINRIILGKDINERNKRRLINIAKKNGFDIYQQKYNLLTSSFSYYKIDKGS